MSIEINPNSNVRVGGDFARVFDHEDYLAMINSLDEASVVLRAHLILEEFLNIWSSRVTTAEDLFAGTFVPFKTKLYVCHNLGLSAHYVSVLDQFNEIRNRYSHRRKYALEATTLDSLRKKIDELACDPPMLPCDQFELFVEGIDSNKQRRAVKHTWATTDVMKRIVIVLVVLVMKLVGWMQREFAARGIQYNLILWPAPVPGRS